MFPVIRDFVFRKPIFWLRYVLISRLNYHTTSLYNAVVRFRTFIIVCGYNNNKILNSIALWKTTSEYCRIWKWICNGLILYVNLLSEHYIMLLFNFLSTSMNVTTHIYQTITRIFIGAILVESHDWIFLMVIFCLLIFE